MRILVLDTIHGGRPVGEAFRARGDTVDLVDVYRGSGPVSVAEAGARTYDLIASPVHLDPDHPLLKNAKAPVITHHEAVRRLAGPVPTIMVEITGAQGKTTTAHALASLLPGPGILHTSSGTYRYPEKIFLSKSSITPGSVLAVIHLARECGGWLVAEESLGITGAGTLGIITSAKDYRFAAGKKSAIAAKIASAEHVPHLLVAEGIRIPAGKNSVVHLEDATSCSGTECTIRVGGTTRRFTNPLLALSAYRTSLMLAATAAVMLGLDPAPLASFCALPGRMEARREGTIFVIDNANSGTNFENTLEAARYARAVSGSEAITLVIGQQEGDGKVCEGFAPDKMLAAVEEIRPDQIVWVGRVPPGAPSAARQPALSAATLEEGYTLAQQKTVQGSIVLAVKTWR